MSLNSWFLQLNAKWKALGLAFALLSFGFGAGTTASGLTHLPARVAALEQSAKHFNQQIDDLSRDVLTIRKANQQQLCLTIAERQHTDWRLCLKES